MDYIARTIREGMADPRAVDEAQKQRVDRLAKAAKALKAEWAEPLQPVDAWKKPNALSDVFFARLFGGEDGKQTRYLCTPNSRCTSYESYLEIVENQVPGNRKYDGYDPNTVRR
jgi:hypothetical protein